MVDTTKQTQTRKVFQESEEDRRAQDEIRSRAAYSLAIMEGVFYRKFGRYLRLLPKAACRR